jgi:subtilisin family serine protease
MGGQVTVQLWQVPVGREAEALAALQGHPQIVYAEPDGIVRAAELPTPPTPTDPLYAASQWSMQRVNASRAWLFNTGTMTTGVGVRVAVIDSGIDLSHPEFAGRIVFSKNYVVPSLPARDDNGHGTHVAGIIAAAQNNGQGISGVAPTVLLDIRRVLSNGQSGLTGTVSNLADAIFEAANDGAKVINLSVETPNPNTTLQTVINLAVGRGVLLVGSAGNLDGTGTTNVYYPAAYGGVMAVAATDRTDSHAFYSRVGPEVEIAAPGGLVQASSNPPVNDPILSTWAANTFCGVTYQATSSYCTSTGTSMAAPFVSGAAALIRSLRPDLSATQVRALLRETAVPIGQDAQKVGSGRLDVAAAVRQALRSDLVIKPDAVGMLLPPGETVTRTMSIAITNPSAESITWRVGAVSSSWVTVTGAATGTISGTARYGRDGGITVAISPTMLTTGTHTAQIGLAGTRGDGSTLSRTLDVSVMVNGAPQRLFLPAIMAQSVTIQRAYGWEVPGATAPYTLTMFSGSSSGLQLPFTMNLKGRDYGFARLSANGLLYLQADPGEGMGDVWPNLCLSRISGRSWLDKGVAGWWAALDPSRGGRVRTFQPAGTPRYVVEFSNVATAASVSPAYTVSFQMVLYPNGNVGLNYRDVPANPGPVTVGVVALDGLLYNQLTCRTADRPTGVGDLPLAGTSYLITGSELY